jgi:hypothetical protein
MAICSGILDSETAYRPSDKCNTARVRASEATYNFEVALEHNYYVGHTGVLVHNLDKIPTNDVDGPNGSYRMDRFNPATRSMSKMHLTRAGIGNLNRAHRL